MELPLVVDAGSRDGTFSKDALMTNFVNGRKRPGMGTITWVGVDQPADALGQGMVGGLNVLGEFDAKIVNRILYLNTLNGATPFPSISIAGYSANVSPYDISLGPNQYNGDVIITQYGSGLIVVNTVSTAVSNSGMTSPLVPGSVFLDTTLYVMDTSGNIRGSALGDITTWNALNTIAMDLRNALDKAQRLTRYGSYVVAFSTASIQFFYDNGNPAPGSPLSPALSMRVPLGTANGYTIATYSEGLAFVSCTPEGALGVHVYSGNRVEKISTEAIDKFLQENKSSILFTGAFPAITPSYGAVNAYGCVTTMNGEEVYILYFPAQLLTLVYGFKTKQWGKLTVVLSSTTVGGVPVFTEAPFSYVFSSYRTSYLTMQNVFTGRVVQVDEGANSTDSAIGQPVVMRVVTQPLFDPTTNKRIRIGAAEVIGDKASEVGYLAYTDDDYQTYSAFESVDLSNIRSRVLRQGSTHRRSYQLQYSGNTRLRFSKLLLDIPMRTEL